MQNHPFLRIAFGCAALFAVLFAAYAVVTSLDSMRFRLEEVKKSVRDLGDTVAALPSRPVSAQGNFRAAEPAEAVEPPANAQYYDPKAQSGGRIVSSIGAEPGNLNFITASDALVSTLWGNAMDSLAEPDWNNPNDYRPMLAESWLVSEDKLTYHIRLRKGILWHDFTDPVTGKEWKNVEVTARDFKFYLDVIKDESVDAAPLRGYFAGIEKINVYNDYEFDVVWNRRYFLSKDITLGLSPLPRHLYNPEGKFDGKKFNDDDARNRMIVGCGPYLLVKWEKGVRFVFERFEKYYGRNLGILPPVKQLSYDVYRHPATRISALAAQDLDTLNLTPEQWINNTSGPEFSEKGFLRKIDYPAYAYNYIGLNQTNPLFQDRRVRAALSHLVDRERILRDVYHGLARPVSGPFFPDSPACDASIAPDEFSVETAKKLLAEAGWRDTDGDGVLDRDGNPFTFTILNPNVNTTYQKILPILKEDMARAGIRMEALSLEWSVVLQRLDERKFDACMIAWTANMRPDPYQLWHSSTIGQPGSSNFISFSNPEADRLIEQIRVEFDDAEREKLYHKFHRLIHDEAPYLFLFSPSNLVATHKRYRNLRIFPGGVPDRILWVPANEQRTVPGL